MLTRQFAVSIGVSLLLASLAFADEATKYAKPELLVEVDKIELLPAGNVILDARAVEDFAKGAIPGARHVNVAQWKAAFGDGNDAKAWSARIGKAGIGDDTTVVIYDRALTGDAARIWWMLKYWGVDDARIVNGGWQAWQASGGQVEPGSEQASTVRFTAEAQPKRLASHESLRAALKGNAEVCVVDARTDNEFNAGIIPTGRHLDWQELVDSDTGKMKTAAELEKLLARIGFDAESRQVTYCQSGGRASVMAFAMELMGAEDVANYHGSWGEWSKTPGAPIERPQLAPVGEQ